MPSRCARSSQHTHTALRQPLAPDVASQFPLPLPTVEHLGDLKVYELKDLCRSFGLYKSGTRHELIGRLTTGENLFAAPKTNKRLRSPTSKMLQENLNDNEQWERLTTPDGSAMGFLFTPP